MPIYEYACRACGDEREVLQKMSDAPLTQCPACAQPALYKKVSAAGFRLAGSGWYETDFKSSGKRNLAGGSDAAAPSAESTKAKPAETSSSSTPASTGAAAA